MEQISYAANNSDIMRKAMQFSLEHLTLEQVLVVVMYGLVVLVSLLGNLLVCKVILFKRAMRRRTTNIFIANLTIADLLMTVFTIPMFIVRNLTDNWPLGERPLQAGAPRPGPSVYVSVLAMTLTAIDRYQALVKPLEPRLSHRLPKGVLIGLMWAAALLLAAPNAVFNIVVEIKMFNRLQMQMMTVGKEGNDGGDRGDGGDGGDEGDNEEGPKLAVEVLHRCKTVYPEHSERLYQRALTGFAFATQFLLPLLVVAFCYLLIGVTITRRKFLGECITTEQAASAVSSKRKTIKMLMLVVAVFALSWLPYNLLYILKDFREVEFSLTEHYIAHWPKQGVPPGNSRRVQLLLLLFKRSCGGGRHKGRKSSRRCRRAAAAVSAASTTERNQSNTEIVSIRGSGSLTR
ncbi:Neuropeptide Y receptor, partial [Tyrophagus putrescentiae]